MTTNDSTVQINAQGRLVIPAAFRKALKLKQGDQLIIRQVGNSLVFERKEDVIKRLRGRFQHIPPEISLADELLAERRGAAARENSDQ